MTLRDHHVQSEDRPAVVDIIAADSVEKLLDRDAGAGCAVCYLVRYAAKKQSF